MIFFLKVAKISSGVKFCQLFRFKCPRLPALVLLRRFSHLKKQKRSLYFTENNSISLSLVFIHWSDKRSWWLGIVCGYNTIEFGYYCIGFGCCVIVLGWHSFWLIWHFWLLVHWFRLLWHRFRALLRHFRVLWPDFRV